MQAGDGPHDAQGHRGDRIHDPQWRCEGAHEALCDGSNVVVQVYMMHASNGLDDPPWRWKCTMRRIDGVYDPQW